MIYNKLGQLSKSKFIQKTMLPGIGSYKCLKENKE